MKRVKEIAKPTIDVVVESIAQYFDHNAPLLAAGLSFYAMFSVAPLGVFAVTLAKVFFNDQEARRRVLEMVTKYGGSDIAHVVSQGIESTTHSTGGWTATIIGAIVVIIGGHSIFVQMRRAMNMIIGEDEPEKDSLTNTVKSAVLERFFSFLAMFLLGGILILFTLATLVGGLLLSKLQEYISLPEWLDLAPTFDLILSFVGVTFIVGTLYRILPQRRFAWKEVFPGAALVAAIFFVLKIAVGYYLEHASSMAGYGAAASMIALMVWVYFSAMLILFGAELNQQILRWKYVQSHPEEVYPSILKTNDKKEG